MKREHELAFFLTRVLKPAFRELLFRGFTSNEILKVLQGVDEGEILDFGTQGASQNEADIEGLWERLFEEGKEV